jgi:Uma2 family endonuclease
VFRRWSAKPFQKSARIVKIAAVGIVILKRFLGRLVEALAEELEIDIASFGSMTCRRQGLKRGFAPDESYWIANEPHVRGQDNIDLEVNPPPDLALEIEISHSTLDLKSVGKK